jgi:hypothetical protein
MRTWASTAIGSSTPSSSAPTTTRSAWCASGAGVRRLELWNGGLTEAAVPFLLETRGLEWLDLRETGFSDGVMERLRAEVAARAPGVRFTLQ